MLLQKLAEYADRLNLPPRMYLKTPVKWLIELDGKGNFLGLIKTEGRMPGKKDRGKEYLVPNVGRSSGVRAKLLADNAEYVLGIGRDKSDAEKVRGRHKAFIECIKKCADATGEEDVKAVLRFLEGLDISTLKLPDDFDPSHNLTFRVDGRLPVELESVKHFWATETERGGKEEECIVCGRVAPVVERHDVKIKRIPGGQSSGMALVSANSPAFESYGLKASLIAPTCATCAEKYAKAANALLRGEETSLMVGSQVYLFWTREKSSFSPIAFLRKPEPDEVKALIESARKGREHSSISDEAFYSVAFSSSGGRVAVRDWLDTTVGNVKINMVRWFKLQKLVNHDGSDGKPISIFQLALSTVRDRDDLPPNVTKALIDTALKGTPLPRWLLYQAVQRIKALQRPTRPLAALIKMVLLSKDKNVKEDEMERLDVSNENPAYLCGRLFAVLEKVQYEAVRPKATIVDRFFGTASTAPASVFGNLVQKAQAHFAKLRKERPGTWSALQRQMEEVLSGLNAFPKVLTMEEQGLFALGYYHQKASDRAGAIACKKSDKQ